MTQTSFPGPVEAEDIQRLDNVLADTPTSAVTRKAVIKRAATGTAAVGAIGALGPIASALAKGHKHHHHAGTGSIKAIIDDAVTAEALAVTYLTGLIENAKATGVSKFVDVLKAANEAEYDHYKALRSLGAKPLTLKFWAPDAFFKPGHPFAVLELAEREFVNAYLIHVTATAKAGMDTAARYGAEILGVEAEHLALVRFAQGKLPNNVGFQQYETHSIGGIVKNLEHAGIGFGKRGKGPGKFYKFPGKLPVSATTPLRHNSRPDRARPAEPTALKGRAPGQQFDRRADLRDPPVDLFTKPDRPRDVPCRPQIPGSLPTGPTRRRPRPPCPSPGVRRPDSYQDFTGAQEPSRATLPRTMIGVPSSARDAVGQLLHADTRSDYDDQITRCDVGWLSHVYDGATASGDNDSGHAPINRRARPRRRA